MPIYTTTDSSGNASYSWKIPSDTLPGTFLTFIKIYAEGYIEVTTGLIPFNLVLSTVHTTIAITLTFTSKIHTTY